MTTNRGARWGALVLVGAIAPSVLALAPTGVEGGERALQQAVAEYEAKRAEVYALMNKAEGEERMKLYREAPWAEFVERFREVAYESDGETAAKAWVWIVRTGKEFVVEDAHEAIENLLAAHMDAAAIGDLVEELQYPGELGRTLASEALGKISDEAPDESLRARARYYQANVLMEGGRSTPEERSRAKELLEGLPTAFPNVKISPTQVERALFELDNLQIGMTAPDFEATDSDGVAFKLSDYRGKVVVIDFWGFW